MIVDKSGEWIVKLGPISRTNQAVTRKQAEEGAVQQILEDTKALMVKAKELVPLLLKGSLCVGGECTPEPEEELAAPQVVSYQLNDGKFFSIASSGFFGLKLVCQRG